MFEIKNQCRLVKKLSRNNIFRILCDYFLIGEAHFEANSLRPIGKKCNEAYRKIGHYKMKGLFLDSF